MGPTRVLLAAVAAAALLASGALTLPSSPAHAAAESAGERLASTAQPDLRTDWRERMLARVNAVRARAGAPALRLCPALARSAESYARQMSRDNRFSHTGADGSTTWQRIASSGYRSNVVGENLAAGQPTVADAMGDWRRSSTHYAAMTDPRFRHVGFGYHPGRSSRYPTFWVQHYGTGGPCS
jgi:uncharacterized protein YkwD